MNTAEHAAPRIAKATLADLDAVFRIVQETIDTVYPRYCPAGAVAFFKAHHSSERIAADIAAGKVHLLLSGGSAIGTVTLDGRHVHRLFVLREYQGKGCGTALMDFAEETLAAAHGTAELDASLPAKAFYLRRGYTVLRSVSQETENGDHLCYDVMRKDLRPVLRADETLEDLQLGGLRILQKKQGFRYGMDSVLLADFARIGPGDAFADLGTGTGILPLLLIGRGKGRYCEAVELQPEYAGMAERSMSLNGLSDRVRVHCADVREAPALLGPCSVDAVVCNPPYGLPGTTLRNPSPETDTARHLDGDGLLPWFRAAHRILRGKGRLSLVFPAPRMLELADLLREARLTPKRFRLVYPRADRPANLVLLEAVKDGKPMLHPEPPLIVYEADGSMTPELKRIYHLEGDSD